MGRASRYAPALAALAVFAACQTAPSDLREWRASDHDHTDTPNAAQVQVRDGGRPAASMMGLDEVTLAAWKSNCTVCHGLVGRGDGPKGPSTRARDLTDPSWHAATTDEQIAGLIKSGKGQMPGFDLPESTIKGLTKLVRLLNVARLQGDPAMGDGGAIGDGGRPRDAGTRDAKAPEAGARDAGLRRPDASPMPKVP